MSFQLERRGHSVRGLANWILSYASDVGYSHTNMGINKLTFFALEALLLKRGVLITNAKVEAWEHGPVFRELYSSFKSYGNGYVTGRAQSFSTFSEVFSEVEIDLSPDDEAILRSELAPLIRLTAAELRALSHRPGGAWYSVWWYDGHANPGMEISPAAVLASHEEN